MNRETSGPVAPITCRDSVLLVSQWRDGILDPQGRQRLCEHVLACERCQVASRQFQALFCGLDELLAGLGGAGPPRS